MPQPVDSRFPAEVQELWAELSSDVVWLHGRWKIYRQLFGTSKERVDLLNETASTFAWMLQDLLLHDVQLAISKIGDPPGRANNKNLTLKRLQMALRDAGETEVADRMNDPLTEFDTACEKVRFRRNKWLAHSDLPTLLNARAVPLLAPSREEIETTLAALRKVMHAVEKKYTESQTAYERFVMKEDGEHLISALLQAKRYREVTREGLVARENLRRRYLGEP
jgi:hypothetical protein